MSLEDALRKLDRDGSQNFVSLWRTSNGWEAKSLANDRKSWCSQTAKDPVDALQALLDALGDEQSVSAASIFD